MRIQIQGRGKGKKVLRIRIRMEPNLLPGSGIIVPDQDPATMIEQISYNFISHFKPVNSGLCLLQDLSMK